MPTIDYDQLITCTEAGHNKFWRGQVVGTMVYITYGRIGALKPARQVRPEFRTLSQAVNFVSDTAAEKCRKKGYVTVPERDRGRYPDCTPVLPPETAGATPQSLPARPANDAVAERGLELD